MTKITKNNKWDLALKRLITCQDEENKKQLINTLTQISETSVLSFINAHAANLLLNNEEFRCSLMNSEYLLRDGSGIQILLTLLKIPAGLNLNGTDFIPEILRASKKDMVISVFGTQGEFLNDGVAAIKEMGFKTIYSEDGFQTQAYYLDKYKQQSPDIVILAMGMPKQELISAVLKKSSPANKSVLIINGGGIIDFMSGRVKRSPHLMRKLGIEWLYRLSLDPKRLWKRNLGSVLFTLRALKYKITSAKV